MEKGDVSDSEGKQPSDSSCYATEDEEEARIQLGPKMSIRQHLEKDKVEFSISIDL